MEHYILRCRSHGDLQGAVVGPDFLFRSALGTQPIGNSEASSLSRCQVFMELALFF